MRNNPTAIWVRDRRTQADGGVAEAVWDPNCGHAVHGSLLDSLYTMCWRKQSWNCCGVPFGPAGNPEWR